MTELEKAARQALEALEDYENGRETTDHLAKVEKATTALRRALEQPAIKQSLTTEQPAQGESE